MKVGMWIFMLVCNLLVPLTMIGFGQAWAKKPPKTINGAYGYRTSMSMKNQDTWDFAHQTCSALWQKVGKVMLPFVVLAQALTLLCPTMEAMCLWSLVPTTLEVIVMAGTIIPVERVLSKQFNKDGSRR